MTARIGSGVRGSMKNLISAAVRPKPEIVLDDAVDNDLRIVRNERNDQDGAHGDRGSGRPVTWWRFTPGRAGRRPG